MSGKSANAVQSRFAGPVPGERQRAADPGHATEHLIVLHTGLVQRIARHLAANLPSTVDIDDLVQSGMVGLLEAAAKFDPSNGACFATYAGMRIRGSMLDDVRRHDWTPRSVHQRYRAVKAAIRDVEGEAGRPARPREICEKLGISLDEYHKILADGTHCRLYAIDDAAEDRTRHRNPPAATTSTPDREVHRAQFREQLARAIDRLPDQQRLVLWLHYEHEMNLKEIGKVLDVSESRVCQIHGQATLRLRTIVTEWLPRT